MFKLLESCGCTKAASEEVSPQASAKTKSGDFSELLTSEKKGSCRPLKASHGVASCLTHQGSPYLSQKQVPELQHLNANISTSHQHLTQDLNGSAKSNTRNVYSGFFHKSWLHRGGQTRCVLHFSTLSCWTFSYLFPSAPATWMQGTCWPVRRLWRVMFWCVVRGHPVHATTEHKQPSATWGSLSSLLQQGGREGL